LDNLNEWRCVVDSRDALTQLGDRGSFGDYLESSFGDAASRGEPLALVIADIDHFKRVNDTHGHPAGDVVLKAVARQLAAVVRSKGECFRYGGEEMTMVLPNHSLNEAITVAERARLAIESMSTDGIAVTTSFGVACSPLHAGSPSSLVQAADEALYDAKDRGRDLVRYFGEPEPARPGPREPERRPAEVDGLTTEQRGDIRKRLLRHESAPCPVCGAYLDAQDFTPMGTALRQYFVMCPGCGLHAHITGDDG
jgi:diguanylate cyclase (GGDEF)-like protein